jgi:hypothetical protein
MSPVEDPRRPAEDAASMPKGGDTDDVAAEAGAGGSESNRPSTSAVAACWRPLELWTEVLATAGGAGAARETTGAGDEDEYDAGGATEVAAEAAPGSAESLDTFSTTTPLNEGTGALRLLMSSHTAAVTRALSR